MFWGLFSRKKPKLLPESEILVFVRGLCNHDTAPRINTSSWAYLYDLLLVFEVDGQAIEVTLQYNSVRRNWSIKIWSSKSSFLFFRQTDSNAINLLIERFDLLPKLQKMIDKDRERDRKQQEAADAIKAKVLG